jgi:hypothetical protein
MQLFGIELSTSQLWLLGIAGACVAFLFQIWIGRHSRRAAASAKFRGRVLEALKGLYPIPSNWPTDHSSIGRHLQSLFPELQAAVTEFRPFLPRREQRRFDEAWKIFRVGSDNPAELGQAYWQYSPHTMDGYVEGEKYHFDNTQTYKTDFKVNVDNLIAFARET